MHICIQAAPCTRTNALGIILATNTAQWTTDCFKEARAQEVDQAYLGEFEIKDFRLKYLHSTDSTRLVTYLRDSSK